MFPLKGAVPSSIEMCCGGVQKVLNFSFSGDKISPNFLFGL